MIKLGNMLRAVPWALTGADMESDEPLDLDLYIESGIDQYEQARERKWDDRALGVQINKFADGVADMLFSSATTLLTTVDHREWRNVAELIDQQLGLRNELLEALQLKVAQQFFEGTMAMAERTLELLRLTLRITPRAQVARFLQAVARTHVLGLNAECAVMCRASVENALNERFTTDRVPWPQNDKGHSPFPLKVETAIARGWLTPELGQAAKDVWYRGSKSAHADPALVTQRLETVAHAINILEALYPAAS